MASERLDEAPVSVVLPKRALPDAASAAKKPPVWPLDESLGSAHTPLPAKCSRHDRADGVCCKDLKGDDERTLIDPDVVRDV
jgi:vacuolar iron transporter family protein